MKWVLCYLNPHDYVSYKTDLSTSSESLQYQDFVGFIHPYISKASYEFYEELNRYRTLLIDTQNKDWKVYLKRFDEPTFDELFQINEKREVKKKNENSSSKLGQYFQYKNLINNISKNNDGQNRSTGRTRETIQSFFNRSRKK